MNFDLRSLQLPIAAILAMAVCGLLRFLARRGTPLARAGEQSISVGKALCWSAIFVGVASLAGGTALWIYDDRWVGSAVATFMGLLFIFAIAPWMTSNAAVSWSEESIEGPLHRLRIPMPHKRIQISWPDILRAGETWDQYWYVEAKDGRRILWNSYHVGYTALAAALRAKRPDLALPPSMHRSVGRTGTLVK